MITAQGLMHADSVAFMAKDNDGSDIRGSIQVSGREVSIEVISFTHGMVSPADGVTRKLVGNRVH